MWNTRIGGDTTPDTRHHHRLRDIGNPSAIRRNAVLPVEQWIVDNFWYLIMMIAGVGLAACAIRLVYIEIDERREARIQKKQHADNVQAWNRLFRCDDTGHNVIIDAIPVVERLEMTQVINLPMVRTPEEIGNDYAFALSIQYLHTDRRELEWSR